MALTIATRSVPKTRGSRCLRKDGRQVCQAASIRLAGPLPHGWLAFQTVARVVHYFCRRLADLCRRTHGWPGRRVGADRRTGDGQLLGQHDYLVREGQDLQHLHAHQVSRAQQC